MEEKQISHEESLAIISQMIQNTRIRLSRGSGSPFLIWGYTTVGVSTLVWVLLLLTDNPQVFWSWLLIPVVGTIGSFYLAKRHRERYKYPTSYIDRTINAVWIVFGSMALLISLFPSLFGASNSGMLMMICTMMGMGTVITGLILRYKPCIIGGLLGILTFPICIFLIKFVHHFAAHWSARSVDITVEDIHLGTVSLIPLFILAFVVMMVIPGHLLNRAARRSA